MRPLCAHQFRSAGLLITAQPCSNAASPVLVDTVHTCSQSRLCKLARLLLFYELYTHDIQLLQGNSDLNPANYQR